MTFILGLHNYDLVQYIEYFLHSIIRPVLVTVIKLREDMGGTRNKPD